MLWVLKKPISMRRFFCAPKPLKDKKINAFLHTIFFLSGPMWLNMLLLHNSGYGFVQQKSVDTFTSFCTTKFDTDKSTQTKILLNQNMSASQ